MNDEAKQNLSFRLYALAIIGLFFIAGAIIGKAALFSIFNSPLFR